MDFTALRDYLDRLPREWSVPACLMTVHVGRETVFQHGVGAGEDSVFWLYSATKVFTAVMFCRMLEQGKLKLTDRAADYLPEFANLRVKEKEGTRPAATELTLLQLITMCGGLNYNIFDPLIVNAPDKSTRGIMRAIAEMPLEFDPGEAYLYSLCHDVLAGVMEVASGVRYGELLHREVIEPLGMKDTCFHPDEMLKARFAPQYQWKGRRRGAVPCGGDNKFCFSQNYDSGGAGLCSTLNDYILLSEALANGGTGRSGYQLLQPATIDALRRSRLTPKQTESFNLRWDRLKCYGYGLGVRTRISLEDGSRGSLGEFGWDGAAGAYCLSDPSRKLSVFYVQHVLDMAPVFDTIHPQLRELVYQCLDA